MHWEAGGGTDSTLEIRILGYEKDIELLKQNKYRQTLTQNERTKLIYEIQQALKEMKNKCYSFKTYPTFSVFFLCVFFQIWRCFYITQFSIKKNYKKKKKNSK